MSFTQKRSLLLASLLTVAVSLAGCGGTATTSSPAAGSGAPAQPAGPVTLTIQLNTDPPKLDPALSTAVVDRQVMNEIYDKLVDIDKDGNIVPDLADKWDISADGKVYTFHLHPGVKFQDGTPFNAAAVKFNLDRIQDAKLGSPRKSEVGPIDHVDVVDDNTVTVTLKQPFSPLLGVLSDRAGMIASPDAVNKSGADYLNHPVGTGAFAFDSRVKGDSVTLVKNKSYWKAGLPKADKLVYKVMTDENAALVNLQSGQIDILTSVPSKQLDALPKDNRVALFQSSGIGFQGIWLNNTAAPFNNKLVRQAAMAATDPATIVKVVFGGHSTPASGPFSSTSPYFDGVAPVTRDVAKAKALLAQANMPNPEVTLSISPSPTTTQMAQVVQSEWQEAGFKVNIEQIEFGALLDKADKKQFQAAQFGWSGRTEPDGNIYSWFYTGAGNNNGGYTNKTVDQLLEKTRTQNGLDRKATYAQINAALRDDAPYIFLYYPLNVIATSPKVKGFVLYPDGIIRANDITK